MTSSWYTTNRPLSFAQALSFCDIHVCVLHTYNGNVMQDGGNVLGVTIISVPHALHVMTSWWRHQMETFSALLAICAVQGQWRRALMFSLVCTRINGWMNNGESGDLRRHRAYYDVTVIHVSVYTLPVLCEGNHQLQVDSIHKGSVMRSLTLIWHHCNVRTTRSTWAGWDWGVGCEQNSREILWTSV